MIIPRAAGYAAWSFVAGASIPVMAILNARAARALGGAASATVLLLAVAVIAAAALSPVLAAPLPGLSTLRALPLHVALGGGIIVALYIMSVTTLAPRFGVANTVLFVVCAQLAAAAAIDEWGLLGAPVRPVTALRAAGIAVVVAGIAISQIGAAGARAMP